MKPSDNEIEMLAAGFAIQHKNGLIRFAHALLEKYASARAIALDASTVVGEAQSEVAKLAEELGDLASDMAYEANQEMDQEKATRAAIIERGERALRRFADAAPQASAEDVRNAALEALEAAQRFIRNGIELGYIRMPDADTPDPAQRTPDLIDAAIRALKQPQADKDGSVDKSPNLQGSAVDRSADLQGRGDDVVLPLLPSPPVHRGHALFAGSQMQTYARTAVLADRQQHARDSSTGTGTWPMLSELHLHALMFAYNEGYSKAYDGRLFPNPFSENGSQAAAWRLGTDDGTEARAALSATQAEQGERDA